MSKFAIPLLAGASMMLSACGVFTPEMREFYEGGQDNPDFENIVLNNVRCELAGGTHKALEYLDAPGPHSYQSVDWIRGLGATVNLKFTVKETGEVNPTVALKPPPPFSFGGGVDVSASASRHEEVEFTYPISDLLKQIPRNVDCVNENGALIQSNLKIKNFIYDKLVLASVPNTVPGAYHTFNYQLTFVTSYDVSATPTWTFKHVTVTPSKLIDLSRMKTSDLTITIGQIAGGGTGTSPPTLTPEALAVHASSLIGQAVSTAIQNQPR